ncbi:MAG: peptide chain release factor aRF-1, partial [Candidatus Aenigmatarchaeota archaeon]
MVTKTESKYKLKKLVEKLDSIKGRHTELVTVYVPQGYKLNEIVNQLREEKGTAENIKSKQTRKNVTTALDKMVQHLRSYKKTPSNGLALFCGNVSESEGKTDVKIWAIEPPEPVQVKLYWCDQEFELEPLEDMLEEREVFGMLVMDKSEADIAILKGKKIKNVKHMESKVPGKTRAGGQSAARFGRIRERMLQNFYNQVGESMKNVFENKEVLGILIGGPGPIKEDFFSGNYLPTDLKEEVIDTKN